MHRCRWATTLGLLLLTISGPAKAQHPVDCNFFGPQHARFIDASRRSHLTSATAQVTRLLGSAGAVRNPHLRSAASYPAGSIDAYIFADLEANGIPPAPATTDWEFIRRVTLDLTGHIPAPDRVLSFVADTTPDKRARLIDELIAKPEWVDKWTMYLGDLYQNNANKPSTMFTRGTAGRNALWQWIRDSLGANKPYNQMATELITATADSNLDNGPINWMIGGVVTGGPVQDITDEMTANVFDTFLGLAHVNCILCHNGRGHLDSISLWATGASRYEGWQLAAFLSHTQALAHGVGTGYWSLADNTPGFTVDYKLNTTSGNRPARLAPVGCADDPSCAMVTPQYIFNGSEPAPGESYRVALARNVTGDFQFARATVNYIWSQFFGRGIVDPPDTFDPARLDPDNPPPDPWSLQPSNARLLNALAQRFIDGGYNLKTLMREIATSDAYQLASHYDGAWNINWEPYFARHFVRRLWAEEVHDAITQSSGTVPNFTGGFLGTLHYAMQFPETVGFPVADPVAVKFLDSFLRGNRDDQPRKEEGSIVQLLNLMNGPFLDARLQIDGDTPNQLIAQNLGQSNRDLVNTLFLNILSRYPSDQEMSQALGALPADAAGRLPAVQDLVWALYNKVDFIFNY